MNPRRTQDPPSWLDNLEKRPQGFYCHAGSGADDVSFPAQGLESFLAAEEGNFWFRHRAAVVVDLIAEFAPDTTIFVEVGSGTGIMAEELEKAGLDVLAVEPLETGARMAAARGVSYSVCSTLEGLDLPGDSVDAIGAFDVIEHLADPQDLLGEIGRVLRPNGRLFVTVPAGPSLWTEHDDWNEHHRRYTRDLLSQELEAAGFRILRSTSMFASLYPPLVLSSAVYRAKNLRAKENLNTKSRQLVYPRPINSLGDQLCTIERRFLKSKDLRIGTSIACVAEPVA